MESSFLGIDGIFTRIKESQVNLTGNVRTNKASTLF